MLAELFQRFGISPELRIHLNLSEHQEKIILMLVEEIERVSKTQAYNKIASDLLDRARMGMV